MEAPPACRELRLRGRYSVPKDPGYRNEDSYQCSERNGIYALSDGASISFDSATWSRILVRRFARGPTFNDRWLHECVAEFAAHYDRSKLPWNQQAAFDRGSFASLLGVRHIRHARILQAVAVGDSIVAVCDGDDLVSTFPYSDAAQFDSSPQLLSTNRSANRFLPGLEASGDLCVEIDLARIGTPTIFLMTDALGHWFLTHKSESPSPSRRLRSICKPRDFARLVLSERANGRMRRDDTTLISLW